MSPATPGTETWRLPLPALATALSRGEVDLLGYLEDLRAHVEATEPALHALVPEANRFERLRREAGELLERYPDPAARPPLFGVPVGVKDIFHAEGFPTGGGSRLPAEELAGEEAASVTRLRRAGALVLGKTVTTEFAYFAPGPTVNPHNPEHTPGGSSSGSAAAIAAGLAPLAFGTQTIGSVIRPAAFCGIVGFKPSYERIDRSGVIPLAPSVDHVGLFTTDLAGASFAAGVLCRRWRRGALAPRSRRAVLGVPAAAYLEHASEEGLEAFGATCESLRRGGFTVKEIHALDDFDAISERHRALVAAEAAEVHREWFERHGELYAPETAELIRRGREVPPEALEAARAGRERLRVELAGKMDAHGLDAWLSPAAPGAAPHGLDATGDPAMNLPWTYAGMPALALPAGRSASGLPLGLQLTGRFGGDEELFAWATQIGRYLPRGRLAP